MTFGCAHPALCVALRSVLPCAPFDARVALRGTGTVRPAHVFDRLLPPSPRRPLSATTGSNEPPPHEGTMPPAALDMLLAQPPFSTAPSSLPPGALAAAAAAMVAASPPAALPAAPMVVTERVEHPPI
jgi:hypothetical protein